MRAAIALLCLAAACAGEPLGERTIEVGLGYQDRTNFGPETARGSATIDTVTGDVVISVSGLDDLGEGDRYEGWLAGGGERPTTLGRFEVDSTGVASFAAVLGSLTRSTFNRVEITVEPEPDPSPKPDVRVSIGGDID